MAEQSTFSATTDTFNKPVETTEETIQETIVDTVADTPIITEEVVNTASEVVEEVKDDSVIDFNLGGEANATEATTTTEAAAAAFDWKEEIKKVDKAELLKESGLSDFAIELDNYIKSGGDPADYISAKAVDYERVSDEDLVKKDLRNQYPNFSETEISRMYNRKYGVNDEMLDEEKEDVLLELKAKGFEIRKSLTEKQKSFKLPEVIIPQKDEAYEQWKNTQSEQSDLINRIQEFYQGHDATKTLNESKRVTINFGEGVKPLNIKIDNPSVLTNAMMDGGQTFLNRSLNEKGEPDVQRQQLGALLAIDPYKAANMIFNYGKSIGIHSKVAEGQNAQRPGTTAGGTSTEHGFKVSEGKFGDKLRSN